MSNVVDISHRDPLARLTREQLIAELHKQVAQVAAYEKDLEALAEAVFPEGDSEEPGDLINVPAARILEGVKSLQEYAGRLLSENDRLRAEVLRLDGTAPVLAEVEAEFAARQSAAVKGE